MIHLEGVSLYFYPGETRILKNIDWHIGPEEKWVLFGPNGSGKTKLLEVMTGYLHPSAGSVTRFGGGVRGGDIRDLRKRIGYITSSLIEKIPRSEAVLDVVLSGYYASIGLYEEPSAAMKAHASGMLATAGMGARHAFPFARLSDGEKHLVLMLRALAADPDLLIFDEPTQGLDIARREELLLAIERCSESRKISVVYVTHHIEEITPFFEKLFMIDRGACSFQGSVSDGLTGERLTGIFGREIQVKKINDRYYSILG